MIYSLTGTLAEKTLTAAVIDCGGVGYIAAMPQPAIAALPAVGEHCCIYTHLAVSENDMSLYGFASQGEREMFMLLISVSGVGPKVGLAILSALAPSAIVLAIGAGDHKAFTAASGVGPKLGQRIVLELKDKVAKGAGQGGISLQDVSTAQSSVPQGAMQQAVAALVSLGYSQSEAAAALAQVDQSLPVAEIIRLALRSMGGAR